MYIKIIPRSLAPVWVRVGIGASLIAFIVLFNLNKYLAVAVCTCGLLGTCVTAYVRDRRRRIAEERRYSGQCASCGYDLTGNVSGICPECGEEVSPP